MRFLLSFAAVFSATVVALAAPGGVASAPARAPAVQIAEQLLKQNVPSPPVPFSPNPFTLSGNRSMGGTEENQSAALAAVMASNKSLLSALADQLEPKGTFVVGGDAIILIGQKKLKVGEKLPISFEGSIYELEITSIETTRFSVRFKNEELTRPIAITKPAK